MDPISAELSFDFIKTLVSNLPLLVVTESASR